MSSRDARSSTSSVSFALALLLVAIASIQGGAALAKSLFPAVGAMGVAAYRLAFAAVILCMFWRPWRETYRGRGKELRPIVLYGAALGVMNLTFYLSLERIPLGIAVALEFTGPLAVAIFQSRKKIDFLWALFAAVGIALIIPLNDPMNPGSTPHSLDPLGVFYALFAGACWAAYIVFGKKASDTGYPDGIVTTLGMTFAAIVALPPTLLFSDARFLDASMIPLGIAVAFFASVLPYSLEMIALGRLPARTFGILMSLEPAIAALAGLVFLNESLFLKQWIAMIFIMIASGGTALSSRPEVEAIGDSADPKLGSSE